jgi:hypothetical protein
VSQLDCDLAVGSDLKTGVSVLESPAYQAVYHHIQYVVERRPGSWLWRRWQVRPHTATGELFSGSRNQCLRVRQQLNCARSNGAWVALRPEYHTV